MAPDLHAADAFTLVLRVTTAMARDGGSESKHGMRACCRTLFFPRTPPLTCNNRTAEDLTATSRRLARYESLLNEILPMVSPEVQGLIEDARDNVGQTLQPSTHAMNANT